MGTARLRPIGEVAGLVVRRADFLRALDDWAGRANELSSIEPPIGALRPADADENGELAATFARLCRCRLLTDQMTVLTTAIIVHERRHRIAWDHARGGRDPRWKAPRDAWVALRPYEQMIDVLRDWLEALHDRACEIGA